MFKINKPVQKLKLEGIYSLTITKNNKIILSYDFHNEIQHRVFFNLAQLVSGGGWDVNEMQLQDLIISSAETIEDYETGSFSQFRTSIVTERYIDWDTATITSNYQIDDNEGQILIKSLIMLNKNSNVYSFVKLGTPIDKRLSNEYESYILTINRKDIFGNE